MHESLIAPCGRMPQHNVNYPEKNYTKCVRVKRNCIVSSRNVISGLRELYVHKILVLIYFGTLKPVANEACEDIVTDDVSWARK